MLLPLYSLVMDWVFPSKLSYRIESLRIWEHLMYVLHVLICGDNGIFTWSTWCMFWWSTCGFNELKHRGWHTFSSWLSGRNFGALFEVLCVGWIDEFEIVWCISYIHIHGYLRWHWSIEVTLGFWLICFLRCYSSMNCMIDWAERIASCYFTTNSWIDRIERITLRWFCTLP